MTNEKTFTTFMLLEGYDGSFTRGKIELIRFDQNNKNPPGGATWERRIHLDGSPYTPTQPAVHPASFGSPKTNDSLLTTIMLMPLFFFFFFFQSSPLLLTNLQF